MNARRLEQGWAGGEPPMTKYPWSRDNTPPPEPQRGFRAFVRRHLAGTFVAVLVLLLIGFVLYPYMVITVPAGQVGVLWKRITGPGIYCWCILSRGTVLNPLELREEGLHIIWPWDKLFLYDLRLQAQNEKFNAISSDGVSVTAEINIRYQLSHDSVAVFHKFIGPNYQKSLLAPEIGSQTRLIISHYPAQEVYVSREKIEGQIRSAAQNSLGEHLNALFQEAASEQQDAERYKNALQNSIKVLDTLVLSIELPSTIVAAINRQTEQYYQIREFKYRAEREAEESKRKQIEANGIAAFQRTVSQGISDSYLRWRGIEATLALAQSSNTKIVIIGNGKDGLPIILGNVDNPSPASKPNDRTNPTTETDHEDTPTPDTTTTQTKDKTKNSELEKQQTKSSSDLSDLKALISRFSDLLHASSPQKNSETETNAK
jgi:regulator of protease activity HflC (stomatin/prohibitin superfamily)